MKNITTPPAPTVAAPITSAQPGGGFCFDLERGWSAVRRSFLRRFLPGYVARMNSLRHGDCPGCPHDIIDSRDLKWARNVCGFWFESKDDRFAWRGNLGLARAGFAEILCASAVFAPLVIACVLGGTLVHPAWLVALAILLPLWGFIFAFFRDPQRDIPQQPDVLVSPADGVITHLEEVDEPGFAAGRAFRVSVFLSVFNVHVNRVPRSAAVARVTYYPGEFLDARAVGCHQRNEQVWVDLTDRQLGCPIRVKQIAGAIARRIVCWLKPGESVQAGERFGMIKFGSRTDILVPPELVEEVKVKIGQAVRGGADVLLRLRDTQAK